MNKQEAIVAVSRNGVAIRKLSPELKADRDVVLASVSHQGYALMYASPELKADRDVVFVAVSKHGYALEYASSELKADPDMVMTAVAQNDLALHFASPELKQGGLRIYCQQIIQRHQLFCNLLHKQSDTCILRQLDSHGPIFATQLKKTISKFAGIATKDKAVIAQQCLRKL
jgi:hypothetical protein